MTKTFTKLTRRESRVLEDMLLQEWDWIEKNRPTYPEYAARLRRAKILEGVDLTPSKMKGCVDAIGKVWPNLKTPKSNAGIYAKLEARVAHIEQQLGIKHDGEIPSEES